MLNKVLETPVDSMVNLIKENNKIKISSLSKKLKLPVEIIEKWLIILEEFGILKLQYLGFEGYVQLFEKKIEKKSEIDINNLKNIFIKKAHLKNLDSNKISKLWKIFLEKYKPEIKKEFYSKAKERGYSVSKIDNAWRLYEKDLEVL